MRKGLRALIALVALVVVLFGLVPAIARAAFERRIAQETESLLAASAPPEPPTVTEDELSGLPEPVQRWLRWAQVVGKPVPRTVRLTQEGRFRLGQERGWMPFTAEEVFTTNPPGFLWTTSMRMFPGVSIVGRDLYANGEGSIEMRLFGLIPVANASGPELNQGALLRYLNEIMWFPAAALSPVITWTEAGPDAATATIAHGGVTAEATFSFDEQGRPVDMRATRYDMGSNALQEWSTPLRAWGEFGGIRVPVEGSGVWKYPTGDFEYIDLEITGIGYES
jgi:hypothetical protein